MVAEVVATTVVVVLLAISAFWLRFETDDMRGNGLFSFLAMYEEADIDMATLMDAITGNNPEDDCDCEIDPGPASKRGAIDALDAENALMIGPSINKTVDTEVVAAVVSTRVIDNLGAANALDALNALVAGLYTLLLLLTALDDADIKAFVSA